MTLDEYLWRNKVSNIDFAASVGSSDSMVSAVKNSMRRPSVELAQRIEKATKGEVKATELLGLAAKPTKKKAKKK
jgi:DNA-binding transcriptional regulator YdaS (Cro superfamily)